MYFGVINNHYKKIVVARRWLSKKNLQNMNTIDSSFENNIANIIHSLDIRVKKVDNECAFWALMDALVDDKSGFICNRNAILKAYIGGYLYTQQIFETKENIIINLIWSLQDKIIHLLN